jgi:S1-C subfamily serine protease
MLNSIFNAGKSSNTLSVKRINDLLQPPSESNSGRNWTPVYLGAAIVSLPMAYIIWLAWGQFNVVFDTVLTRISTEFQIIFLLFAITAFGILSGLVLNVFGRKITERKWIQSSVNKIGSKGKMAVYASGSGALGISRGLTDDQHTFRSSQSLVGFFHPPLSARKKGGISIADGGIIAEAPVQDAMGHLEAAIEGRSEEGKGFQDAHDSFLNAVGGESTKVEWDIVHLGEGHTSESCHLAWSTDRTASRTGASPARTVVLVKDRSVYQSPIEDSNDYEVDGPVNLVQLYKSSDGKKPDKDENHDINGSLEQSLSGVVRIVNGEFVGSGLMIHEDGFILTCDHILEDPQTDIEIWLSDGVVSYAEVISRNPDTDLALLKCIGVRDANTVEFRDTPVPHLGESVVAAGFPPTSKIDGFKASIAHGSIRSLERVGDHCVVRVDAEVEPGYSGGPIFDSQGRMVAMITSLVKDEKSIPPCTAITSAISAQDLRKEIDKMQNDLRS